VEFTTNINVTPAAEHASHCYGIVAKEQQPCGITQHVCEESAIQIGLTLNYHTTRGLVPHTPSPYFRDDSLGKSHATLELKLEQAALRGLTQIKSGLKHRSHL